MRKCLIVGASLLLASTMALAADKTIPIKNTFSQLSAEDGFEIDVKCGDSNKAELSGPQAGIDSVQIVNDNGNLKVHKSGHGSDKGVEITLTTTSPLNKANIQNGVELDVKSCAVNKDAFTLNMRNGAKAELKGKTKKFNLKMSTGVTFGDDDKGDFMVDSASVNISKGARAYLCDASKVSGSAKMGAIVYVGSKTDASGLSTSMGAMKSSC